MADFGYIQTVNGAALSAALQTGSVSIPAENWEFEVGQSNYTVAVDPNGFATQTALVNPYNPRKLATYPVPPPIYSANKWTFNFRFPPQSQDFNVNELGLWVYATVSGNDVTLTTPLTGAKTLVAVTSDPDQALFTISAGQHDNLVPLRGAIGNLNSNNITLADPNTYPVATSDFPGNVRLATLAQAQAAIADLVNTVAMTPLRTWNLVKARMATQAEAEAGTSENAVMNPLRTKQAIDALVPPVESVATLPSNPAVDQVAFYRGTTLRTLSGWGNKQSLAAGTGSITGMAFDPTNDELYALLLVGSYGVYMLSGGVWTLLFNANAGSVAVDNAGVVFTTGSTSTTVNRYTYSNGTWSNAVVETAGFQPSGMAYNPSDGRIYGITTTGALYAREAENSWQLQQDISALTDIRGLAFTPTGTLYFVDSTTDLLYEYKNGSVSKTFSLPSAANTVNGLAINSGGELYIGDSTTDGYYIATVANPTYPDRPGPVYWNGTRWLNF